MTDLIAAAEAISRIPGIDPATTSYRSIGGGLSNRSWLVQTKDRKLVLRLDGPHTGTLGLNRPTELAILEQAAKRDIAPEVVFADPEAGVLVYEYLSGRCWTRADLEKKENLQSLARLLREVHALPRSDVAFDAAGAAERYLAVIRPDAELYSFGVRCREIVASIPPPSDSACCHNDVVAANVLEMHDLRLLDWEYACDNDPLFDLASLIGYHDLSEAQAELLLDACAGAVNPELRSRLQLQLRLYDAIQWLWLAVLHHLSRHQSQRARLDELARRIR